MNWKQATKAQLLEILFHDREARFEHKLAALNELRRRMEAKRANVKWRAMGRNWG